MECEPGSASAEPLERLRRGPGEGERLLPLERTSSPVDIDLINNIMRLPYRQRFSILLSELGTGLAGRGEELNEVIHRANPALRETDRVLAILAGQNRVLADLARDSDAALGPLARERSRVGNWIVEADNVAEASAERRDDIRRGINLLPAFLSELRPLMADLEKVADQGTPLLRDLGEAAPQMDRLIRGLGTVSQAGRESLPSLGDALERGLPALNEARPLFRDLTRLGRQAEPVSEDLDDLTASLDRTGGVERINDFLYYLALNINGFDSVGHYLRAGLSPTPARRTAPPRSGRPATPPSTTRSRPPRPRRWRRATPPHRSGGHGDGSVAPKGTLLGELLGPAEKAADRRRREEGLRRLRERAAAGSPALGEAEPALDYLLGGER